MRKFQVITLTLLACVVFTAVASAQVNLIYYSEAGDDPTWGSHPAGTLIVDSADRSITTLELISTGNVFVPANIAEGTISFPSLITEEKLFKLGAGADAFTNVNFGNVLPGGNDAAWLQEQFGTGLGNGTDGSLTPDGSGNNALDAQGFSWVVAPVPEPSSIALIGFGLLGLLSFRRKRS